ncbi:MAG TPA: hypothetical protein PLF21_00900 [Exilispira sp.]|nr:hypothetical protein [Exilispira sp.]
MHVLALDFSTIEHRAILFSQVTSIINVFQLCMVRGVDESLRKSNF